MKNKSKLQSAIFYSGIVILIHLSLLAFYWILKDQEAIGETEFHLGNFNLVITRWLDPFFFGPFVMSIYAFMGDDIKRMVRNFLQNDFYEDCSKGSYEKDVTKICTIGVATGIAIGLTSSLGTDLVLASSILFSAWFGAMLIAPIIKDLYSSLWILRPSTIMYVIAKTSALLGITIGATVATIASITSAGSATGILFGLVSGFFATTGSIIIGTLVGFTTPVILRKRHYAYMKRHNAWKKRMDENSD